MSDSRDVSFTIMVAFYAICFVILIGLFVRALAQENDASYPQTRSWLLGSFERWPGSAQGYVNQIRVVDTAGVCLYILEAEQSTFSHQRTQFVAVPKTQLPKGAGCQ